MTIGERIAALRTLRRLPYLIIVIDEFAELMKISKDSDVNFRQLVDSLTATGRSLGMHLLLASQNITSAVSDEAKNNTSVYLALKLRDRSTSMEMIGTDAAARPTMPGHGRTYLKTAAGRFDYFQSTYTGGSWKPRQKLPVLREKTFKGGFHGKEIMMRKKPYGSLATRTLGIYDDSARARNGIELAYDSILRGIDGRMHRNKVRNKRVSFIDQFPCAGP